MTSIEYDSSNLKVINDLKLLLTSISQSSDFSENGITILWHDFKSNLINISRILKSHQVRMEFDDLSKKLVDEFIKDRNSIKGKGINIPPIDDLPTLLKEIGFKRPLKDEQIRDVKQLLILKHGANFSVPGAGKTTAILAVYSVLKHFNLVTKLFVTSPINAFISWEDEIKNIFDVPLSVRRLTTFDLLNPADILANNPDVLLVNYEKLRRDISSLIPYFFQNDVHLILDESHRIKSGINNLSYAQITKLSDLAKRRDILSGTPMPQSYLDLEPQFAFLWPAERIIPEESTLRDDTKIEQINSSIKDLYVRTTKKELGLKDPVISYIPIDMGPLQNELYRLFKSETARLLSGMDNPNNLVFRKIGKSVVRLLQAATNPMLLGANDEYDEDIRSLPDPAKIWALLEEFVKYEKPAKIEFLKQRVEYILNESSDNKIVIWSYFVRNIQLLERLFKNYNPVSIYGGIATGSDEDETYREGRIRKFHEDSSCRLMIANPQACGEGISLHRVCHHAIYLDRSFNAAHFLQSVDRIHRLGLENTVSTYIDILISKNTIDELLIDRLNEKILNMGEILDDPYLRTMAYDPADIPPSEDDGIDSRDIDALKKHVSSNE